MTDQQKIKEYMTEILSAGGELPKVHEDPEGVPMNIANLQDVWRKLQ